MREVVWLCLFALSLLYWPEAKCIDTLVSSWSMDEMGGTRINDRIGKHPLAIPPGFSFLNNGNPQGLSSLRAQPNLDLIESLQNFPRPAATTVSGWFRTSNISEMALYSWRDTTYTLVFRILAGRLGFYLNSNAFATSQVLTRDSYNDDKWHFFATTISDDQGTGTLYVDTHLLPDQPPLVWSLGTAKQHTIFQIGGLTQNWGSINFDGFLDDLRIYNSILSKEDIILIATLADTPCAADVVIGNLLPLTLSTRPNSYLNIVVDSTNSTLCADAGTGLCTNDRYGVAVSVCAGSLSGVSFSVVRDNVRLGSVKSTDSGSSSSGSNSNNNVSACMGVYDGTKYVNDTSARVTRMCNSTPFPFFGIRTSTSPISTNSFSSLVVGSGNTPLSVEISITVGNSKNTETPSLDPPFFLTSNNSSGNNSNNNYTCNSNNQLTYASWSLPLLVDNTVCIRCVYQVWYVPVSKIISEQINVQSMCGLNMYGFPLAISPIITPFFQSFVLPPNTPPGEYIWVIVAINNNDNSRSVTAVFDMCRTKIDGGGGGGGGLFPFTYSPTSSLPTPSQQITSGMIANTLFFPNTDFPSKYPPGPARDAFQSQFLNNLSLALATNVSRFNATTLQGGNVGFLIGNPYPGDSDQRSAENLTATLYALHNNHSSVLYALLPGLSSDPSAFQSSSRSIQQQQQQAANGQRGVASSNLSKASKLALGLGIAGGIFWCCLVIGRLLRLRGQSGSSDKKEDEAWDGPDRVIAVHAYRDDQADPKQDLLFEAGTIINVVSRECDDGPGWLVGQLNRKTGMVPKAYVRDYFGH